MPNAARRLIPVLAMTLSAVMLGLAFPPYGLKPLAYVALIPAGLAAVRSVSPLGLFASAWLIWGLWWGVIGRWMIPVTFGGHLCLSILMGFEIAVCLVVVNQLARHRRWPAFVALPFCWMAMEVLRSIAPFGGMNWFTLAQSQTPFAIGHSSYVIQMADLLGWPAVTWFVALWSGFVVDLFTRRIYAERQGRKRRLMPAARWGLATVALSTTAVMTYGYARLADAALHTRPGPNVGIVQTNIPQSNKNQRTAQVDRTMWRQLEEGTAKLFENENKPDWLVWPETSVPGPIDDEGVGFWIAKAERWRQIAPQDIAPGNLAEAAAVYGVAGERVPAYLTDWYAFRASLGHRVRQLARERGVYLIAGVPASLSYPDGPSVNRVVLIDADGVDDPLVYDKMHRVPFGEYIPLVDAFPAIKQWFIQTLTPYDHDYSLAAGKQAVVFTLPPPGNQNKTDGAGTAVTDSQAAVAGTGAVPGAVAETLPGAGVETLPGAGAETLPGAGAETLPGAGVRVATPICFEDTVARLCWRMVYGSGKKGVDVLVNLTNDGWFGNSSQGPQHLQLAAMRCVENRVPMIRAVNTGVSGLIDSNGRVVTVLTADGRSQGVAAQAVVPVTLDRRVGLFGLWGMWPAWTVSAAVGVASILVLITSISRRWTNRPKPRKEPPGPRKGPPALGPSPRQP